MINCIDRVPDIFNHPKRTVSMKSESHTRNSRLYMFACLFLLAVLTAISCSNHATIDRRPFTLIALPDTQYYTFNRPDDPRTSFMNARKEMFQAQTEWIIRNRTSRNIQFVLHLGDIVYNTGKTYQWEIGRECLYVRGTLVICASDHSCLCSPTNGIIMDRAKLSNLFALLTSP